jgi:hypothetical protein
MWGLVLLHKKVGLHMKIDATFTARRPDSVSSRGLPSKIFTPLGGEPPRALVEHLGAAPAEQLVLACSYPIKTLRFVAHPKASTILAAAAITNASSSFPNRISSGVPLLFSNAARVHTSTGARMFTSFEPPSLPRSFLVAGFIFTLYVSTLYLYRLFFHPLAKYPGPKLAAISNWYEFYYDVYKAGDFTRQIQELHKIYGSSPSFWAATAQLDSDRSIYSSIANSNSGPIIRITPSEIHINDPDFYTTLYERAGRRDKYAYFSGRFGYASDSFSTIHHDVHRLRRKALSPFFSAKRITDFQPVIRAKVEKLCTKFKEYEKDGRILPLNLAWMALTTDTITEYSFARAYNQLESPNFEETLHEALVTIYTTGQFALHCPIVFPILDMLPDWFVLKAQPVLQPVVGLRRVILTFPSEHLPFDQELH